ncbi:MAG: methyltransferase domain-containing protein [Bacteroidetes bacterium]|nr:methyltransferase domain-containing protein [Bacteroidota bacterium]
MEIKDFSKANGHWILAKMGKKVLRPGGKELTQKLIEGLNISKNDDVVEFAPGLGYTASLALNFNPKSYLGIDADEEAVASLSNKFQKQYAKFLLASAADTKLESNSKSKVYGEAMLTMHADHRKSEIIKEAARILKIGGLYAIHELGLTNVDDTKKSEIQKELALAVKVNARPLTEDEWKSILEKEGFKVKQIFQNKIHLLEFKRVVDDEGFFRTLKIGFNIACNQAARKRVLGMRKIFKKNSAYMNAIVVIAEKIN